MTDQKMVHNTEAARDELNALREQVEALEAERDRLREGLEAAHKLIDRWATAIGYREKDDLGKGRPDPIVKDAARKRERDLVERLERARCPTGSDVEPTVFDCVESGLCGCGNASVLVRYWSAQGIYRYGGMAARNHGKSDGAG